MHRADYCNFQNRGLIQKSDHFFIKGGKRLSFLAKNLYEPQNKSANGECQVHVQRSGVQLMKAMEIADVGEGDVRCLEDVAQQFKAWRESRVRGERIPAALWVQAVRLCPQHTPQRVAGVLRVGLASLIQRLGRTIDRAARHPGPDTEFVELIMSSPTVAMPGPGAPRLGFHAGTPENFVTLGSTPKPSKFPGG